MERGLRLTIAFDVDEVLSRWQWHEWFEGESHEWLPIKSAASINFSLG